MNRTFRSTAILLLPAALAMVFGPADATDPIGTLYRPLTLPRLIEKEFGNVVQHRQNMERSIAAANSELAQARAAYWRCHPKCTELIHEEYVRRLIAKDLWYLYQDMHSGPARDSVRSMVPRSVKIDGGIHAECAGPFFAWKSLVAGRAGDVSGVPGLVNAFKVPQAIQDTKEEYAKYAECRDEGEYKRSPLGLSAAAVPQARAGATVVRHALVCWPLHIDSKQKEMNPLPPAAAAHYESIKSRILQAAADRNGAVSTGAARGQRPVIKVGFASSNEPPIAVEFPADGLWWACSGGGRPQLLS